MFASEEYVKHPGVLIDKKPILEVLCTDEWKNFK